MTRNKPLKPDATEARFTLRLPPDLYRRVNISADADYRSMNAQLVYLLELGIEALEARKKS